MTGSIFLRLFPFNCINVVTVIISLALHVYPLSAMADSSDDYLNELEVEAQRSANVSKLSKSDIANNPNLEKFDTFTKMLKFERPMTFRFFLKLNKKQQQSIVDNFTKHKKISLASKNIFDLYFNNK